MAFDRKVLAQITDRLILSDLVGTRVTLKRQGHTHWGLCPFHTEKTPSFSVSNDKGFYHCFGCGEHGDAFDFLHKTKNLSFPEAIRELATLTGVTLPAGFFGREEIQDEETQRQKRCYEILEWASKLFSSALLDKPGFSARTYLTTRQITPDVQTQFGLGFGVSLLEEAKKLSFSLEDLALAGLITEGPRPYERFLGRLVFPIRDRHKRVIGFGGRVLPGDPSPAKYINSPNTPLFHKGETLYGLDLLDRTKSDTLVVAEGYLDVIALWAAGLPAVAPLGTALTEEQIQLLWKYVPSPILCFDGDPAGERAAERALVRALPLLKPGKTLQFQGLPPGDDPHSLWIAGKLEPTLKNPLPFNVMLWTQILSRHPLTTPEDQAAFKAELLNHVETIIHPDVQRAYKSFVYDELGKLWASNRYSSPHKVQRKGQHRSKLPFTLPSPPASPADRIEQTMVVLMARFSDILGEYLLDLEAFSLSEPLEAIRLDLLSGKEIRPEALSEIPASLFLHTPCLHLHLSPEIQEIQKAYADLRLLLQERTLKQDCTQTLKEFGSKGDPRLLTRAMALQSTLLTTRKLSEELSQEEDYIDKTDN